MSGKRISKSERRVISGQRRYVKRIRENDYAAFGIDTTESEKVLRAYSRAGK